MKIYTDGSCSKNPGSGGYGVIILDDYNNFLDCYSHTENYTTNNRQEMKAILFAFLRHGVQVNEIRAGRPVPTIYSDSAYAIKCFTDWIFKWAKYDWTKTDGKPPENLDLLLGFYEWWKLGYRIGIEKVKGHADNRWNNLADELATGKITCAQLKEKFST